MKKIHEIKIMLDEDMTLEGFVTLINGALKTSDFKMGSGYKGNVVVLSANQFQLQEKLYGNVHTLELREDVAKQAVGD